MIKIIFIEIAIYTERIVFIARKIIQYSLSNKNYQNCRKTIKNLTYNDDSAV